MTTKPPIQEPMFSSPGVLSRIWIRYFTDMIDIAITNENLAHGLLSGLSSDDHTQYHTDSRGNVQYLNKANTNVFVPNADYEPATKKYVDDEIDSIDIDANSDILTLYWMGI